jgi:VanZ like family/Concanavalin A-like lectin/glucanases superfamily
MPSWGWKSRPPIEIAYRNRSELFASAVSGTIPGSETKVAAKPVTVMDQKHHTAYKTLAGGVCLCVLGITLTAGLWPFHVPTNQVNWLKTGDGLEFGRHGSVVTSGAIRESGLTNASATLEIWLEPAQSESNGTILSFERSAHPGEPFSLHQKGDALSIRRNNVDPQGISRTALFYVGGVFQLNKPVFVTVTLDSQGTSVYVNGVLAEVSHLSGTWNDLTGRVVLANAPTSNDSWSGKILGLAIYQQKLTASRIVADYLSWMTTRKPILSAEGGAALYLFDEHGGAVARNRLDPATDLTIPKHYFILHPGVMVAPWREFHATWGYWQDAAVNIAGFALFGFCGCAYLSLVRVIKYPGATTVFLGLFTSLAIELLQVFLPTRVSDTTDLITNTLGAAIGVMICRSSIGQTLLTKTKGAIARTNSPQVGIRRPG